MDDHFVDFLLISLILLALLLASCVLLMLYSKTMKRLIARCTRRKGDFDSDVEARIPPKRTTIRVVKSVPTTPQEPTTPTFIKTPARRVFSNPAESTLTEISPPPQKFVFIYPKRLTYQDSHSTYASTSTKSSYLPNQLPPSQTRRNSR